MRKLIRTCVIFSSLFLPQRLKRWLLTRAVGYEIHPSARIGISWVNTHKLKMAKNSRIGRFNVIKSIDLLEMMEDAGIGSYNTITCASNKDASHDNDQNRSSSLLMREHSSITMWHLIDCNAKVTVGAFATIAGYRTQILTHSINIYSNRQESSPVSIGRYCFVGTRCILLGSAVLPDRCVLGAGSVLGKELEKPGGLYAGAPAELKKFLPDNTAYFKRTVGFVD